MSSEPDFVGLMLDGGALVCRRPSCFARLDYGTAPRRRIVRYLRAEEIGGQKCAACRTELAPKPSFLR